MGRRLLLVVVVSGLLVTTLLVRPALATCTDAEKAHQQELRTNIDLAGDMFLANGSSGIIWVRDRDLNPCGTGSAEDFDVMTLSTSIIHNASLTKWVEVGWVEYVPANQYVKKWRIFYETENQGGLGFGAPLAAPSSGPYNSRFWVRKRTGSPNYQWFQYVDVDMSGSADWSHQLTSTMQNGYATGETERSGGCATGAADYHYDLEWLGSDLATWHNWQDNAQLIGEVPTIPNWDSRWLSPSSYDVYKICNC